MHFLCCFIGVNQYLDRCLLLEEVYFISKRLTGSVFNVTRDTALVLHPTDWELGIEIVTLAYKVSDLLSTTPRRLLHAVYRKHIKLIKIYII